MTPTIAIAAAATTLGPAVEGVAGRLLVIGLAYAVALLLSGHVFRLFVKPPPSDPPTPPIGSTQPHKPEVLLADSTEPRVLIRANSVLVSHGGSAPEAPRPRTAKQVEGTGRLIGKCENVIIVTLVLLSQFSALGLIFAAKGIVRQKDIIRDADYYLGGTLVNFAWSLIVGLVARTLCFGIG